MGDNAEEESRMSDREQRLIEAAMRYRALLAGPDPVNIREFVAGADPDLRDELAEYLELLLLTPEPEEPITLAPDEQALVERVAERARQRFRQLIDRPIQTTWDSIMMIAGAALDGGAGS